MFSKIFLAVVLFLIFFNFFIQFPNFTHTVHGLKAHQPSRLGHEFIPFVPFLQKVRWAGYATCRHSDDPNTDVTIMGPYQQAQFVLNPTILDNIHPIDHRFLILYCPEGETLDQGEFTSYMILKSVKDFSLLYRKPGP